MEFYIFCPGQMVWDMLLLLLLLLFFCLFNYLQCQFVLIYGMYSSKKFFPTLFAAGVILFHKHNHIRYIAE